MTCCYVRNLRYNFDAEPMSSERCILKEKKITFLPLVKWLAILHWAVITGTQGTIQGQIVENFKEVNPVKGFLWSSWLSLGRKYKAFQALCIDIKSVVMQNENPLLPSSQTLLENWAPLQNSVTDLLLGKGSLLQGWLRVFLAAVWLPLFTLAVGVYHLG